MEIEKSEKVLAMYHAVWQLLSEGKNLEKLKVSDITECAGIGKGTAYEYFRSKEEIVTKALQYNCLMQVQILVDRAMKEKCFRKSLEACFDWIAENHDRFQMVFQIMKKAGAVVKNSDDLCGQEENCIGSAALWKLTGYIIQLGRKEKLIRENLSDYLASVQILSQLLGFFACQELLPCKEKEDMTMTKAFLCDNIIKSLSC